MSAEQRDPAAGNDCVEMEGRGEMIKAPIDLQDLRRRLYVKAKAEPSWRFWGIYVHVCKMETLREAYALAKANNGAPGIDGVTFEVIEARGTESFLGQIRDELIQRTYRPMKARQREIPALPQNLWVKLLALKQFGLGTGRCQGACPKGTQEG